MPVIIGSVRESAVDPYGHQPFVKGQGAAYDITHLRLLVFVVGLTLGIVQFTLLIDKSKDMNLEFFYPTGLSF